MSGLLKRSSRLPDPINFPAVKFTDIKFVEIFPPIGVARLGDSMEEYFLGPELPIDNDKRANLLLTKDNKFRDSQGHIRRQAARFRVYAYNKDNKILGEVNVHNGYTLNWTVHVMNMKAAGYIIGDSTTKRNPGIQGELEPHKRTKLIVDPKEKTIIRKDGNEFIQLDGTFEGSFPDPIKVNLGQLQVDNAGRLVFVGAKGGIFRKVPKDTTSLDNPDCVDDACDGWVNVTIEYDNNSSKKEALHKAAVLSGPPKFSWDLRTTTSILDLIEDVYQDTADIKPPDFNMDLWPVLEATSLMSWVDKSANDGHGPSTGKRYFLSHRNELQSTADEHKAYKAYVFKALENPNGGGGKMPKLKGSSALTKLQYGRFDLWKQHKFNVTPLETFVYLEDMALAEQTKGLTRANLEMTIGGSFSPGIEACNVVKDPKTYDLTIKPTVLDPPYRVDFSKILPGDLTVGLSLPWQADFEQCNDSWWPAARPVSIKINPRPDDARVRWARGAEGANDGHKMLKYWDHLGFIIKPLIGEDTRVESERKSIPQGASEAET